MASLGDIIVTQTKLETKFKSSRTIPLIDQLIATLETERESRQKGLEHDNKQTAERVKTAVETFQKAVGEDQKETYNAQSKHGKAIAKRFKVDLTAATDLSVFEGKKHLINNAIALNFVRQGQFDLAESFAQEAQLELDANLVTQFKTMYTIIESLERDDLSEAIRWAAAHRARLTERKSTLEFELHKIQFMRIFCSAHVFEAIQYAQLHFPVFAARHLKEIQQLMASAAFHGNIQNSPYNHLYTAMKRTDVIKNSFVQDFTALLGMTPVSPLLATVEAASLALPTLIKLSSLKLVTSEGSTGVDLPLPAKFRYHSVFVCPVTKEVGGDAWMLACGHVIGADAMQSLSKGTPKLKCPYCPAICELKDGVALSF